jgi:hypothetical protein
MTMKLFRSRRLLGLAAAAALGTSALGTSTLVAAGPAQAEPVYRFVANYTFLAPCRQAGDAGVQSGGWDAYQCRPRPVGLDVFWSLWVTP